MVFRALLTTFILFGIWLLLSGHFGSLLLSLGLMSCIFLTWISFKLKILDPESNTLRFILKLPKFLPWFFFEILKSNIDVSWRILHPKLPISPTISTLPIAQHSDLGKATYANCITLTPGTYTLRINPDEVEVHSLTKGSAENLQEMKMSKRLLELETISNQNKV